MARPIVTTVTLGAAVANAVGAAQAIGPGLVGVVNGTLAVNGVAKLDAPRRIGFLSSGNDSAIKFTVTGTARPEMGGAALTETVQGTNAGTAQTTQDFATVTGFGSSAPTAGTVSVGTTGTGSGPWVVWDQNPPDFQVSCVGYILSGAPTWGVEYTYDDPFGTWLPAVTPFPRALQNPALSNQVASGVDGFFTNVVRASRLTLTAVGSVQLTQTQQGN